jgi:hypothetical protein
VRVKCRRVRASRGKRDGSATSLGNGGDGGPGAGVPVALGLRAFAPPRGPPSCGPPSRRAPRPPPLTGRSHGVERPGGPRRLAVRERPAEPHRDPPCASAARACLTNPRPAARLATNRIRQTRPSTAPRAFTGPGGTRRQSLVPPPDALAGDPVAFGAPRPYRTRASRTGRSGRAPPHDSERRVEAGDRLWAAARKPPSPHRDRSGHRTPPVHAGVSYGSRSPAGG